MSLSLLSNSAGYFWSDPFWISTDVTYTFISIWLAARRQVQRIDVVYLYCIILQRSDLSNVYYLCHKYTLRDWFYLQAAGLGVRDWMYC